MNDYHESSSLELFTVTIRVSDLKFRGINIFINVRQTTGTGEEQTPNPKP